MRYLSILILIISFGCSEQPKKEPIPTNHNIQIKEGEVQLIIEPEYDHYVFGENIWLKVSINNNTDKDYYVTYLPDKFSVPLKIETNNGNENIRLRENDEKMGPLDSVKLSPNSTLISLINLTENYFDQRYVTKGMYCIKGEYEKYPHRTILIPTRELKKKTIDYPPAIQSNTIKIEILPSDGKEELISNILFNNIRHRFNSHIEKLEYLVKYYPNSKFYPQIFSEYIYYLAAQKDSSKLFNHFYYFLDNIASYETIMVLHRVSEYLRIKLYWDYTKRRNYFLSLKEKYNSLKVAECIDVKMGLDEYYKKANERIKGWR